MRVRTRVTVDLSRVLRCLLPPKDLTRLSSRCSPCCATLLYPLSKHSAFAHSCIGECVWVSACDVIVEDLGASGSGTMFIVTGSLAFDNSSLLPFLHRAVAARTEPSYRTAYVHGSCHPWNPCSTSKHHLHVGCSTRSRCYGWRLPAACSIQSQWIQPESTIPNLELYT